jgi:hypothetical protein
MCRVERQLCKAGRWLRRGTVIQMSASSPTSLGTGPLMTRFMEGKNPKYPFLFVDIANNKEGSQMLWLLSRCLCRVNLLGDKTVSFVKNFGWEPLYPIVY